MSAIDDGVIQAMRDLPGYVAASDAVEEMHAELTRLRDHNAQLEKAFAQKSETANLLLSSCHLLESRIASLEATVLVLREALELYREAVRIDTMMEGPRFAGANTSALRRAWEHDRDASESVVKSEGES